MYSGYFGGSEDNDVHPCAGVDVFEDICKEGVVWEYVV